MKLLDLFCGAGGAAMGYHRVGFEVVGVDINPQPHYPFKFYQADALTFPLNGFDVIHASPPCQIHSAMTKGRWQYRLKNHINLIPETRKLLISSGAYYVIENVIGAKVELIAPIMLCGTMFNLETKQGSQLRRHRLFECSFPVILIPECSHKKGASVIGVYGGGQHPQRRKIPNTIGAYGHSGGSSKRDYLDFSCFSVIDRRDAMGIDWMTGKELSQAIPPAYSFFIGKQLIKYLQNTK
ncbi:MAG TPA: DNA cytosine methyltransferase [Leeuwenhoekiella sp.]|nr:DNA cytosine methyltransferase [Leeuwenhoekiella sp.]